MAKKVTIKQPAVGGIAPRTIGYDVPEEGEIYREKDYSGAPGQFQIFKMVGGMPQLLTGAGGEKIYWEEKTGKTFSVGSAGQRSYLPQTIGAGEISPYNVADVTAWARKQKGMSSFQWNKLIVKARGLAIEKALEGYAGGFAIPGEPTEKITGPGALTYKGVPGYGQKKISPITQEQYQMTKEEMMGGAAGQAAYTKRIADLRAGITPTPTPTPTTVKRPAWVQPGEQWRAGETEVEHQARVAEEARNDAAAKANEAAQTNFDALPGDEVSMRDSVKILEDIQDKLEETEEKIPEPTSLVDLFESKKAELGIEPLETELAGIDSDIERIQTELLVQAEEAGERLVSTREIGRAKGALQKRADREIALLNIERSAVARQLSNKYSSLEMVMNMTQQDFTNSSKYYTDRYNRTISLFNLALGLEEKEYTRAEKAETDARANWDVVTNAMEENGISYGDLTDDQKLKLDQLETQAGLPAGFSEKILASVDPDKTVVSKITSTDKSQISILYDDGTVEVFSTGLVAELEKPTAKEVEATEIVAIKERLIESKRGGEFADGNVYLEERRKSSIGPTEFDKRFGDLLSPGDRVQYGLEKEEEEVVEEFITTDYIKENVSLKALEDYAKEEDYKGWKTTTKVENLLIDLMKDVGSWRIAGHSDKTIWENILKKIQ